MLCHLTICIKTCVCILATEVTKSPLGTYRKVIKTVFLSTFPSRHLTITPDPPRTMLFCLWDTWCCYAHKIFPLPHLLLPKCNIDLGEGGILKLSVKCECVKCPRTFSNYCRLYIYEQCCFIYETLQVVVHVKFFHYHMYFSQQRKLFGGGEREVKVQCRIGMWKVS